MTYSIDGNTFNDLKEYRTYLFQQYLRVTDQSNQTILKNPGQIQGQKFELANLQNCTIQLLDNSDNLQADNITDCKIFIGPSFESVVLNNCTNCQVTVACKELRLKNSSNCTFNVFSLGGISLEDCHGINICKFNGAYSGLSIHFQNANFDPSKNNLTVTDFNKNDDTLPQPHFTIVDTMNEPWEIVLENAAGLPENPTLPNCPEAVQPPMSAQPLPPTTPEPDNEIIQANEVVLPQETTTEQADHAMDISAADQSFENAFDTPATEEQVPDQSFENAFDAPATEEAQVPDESFENAFDTPATEEQVPDQSFDNAFDAPADVNDEPNEDPFGYEQPVNDAFEQPQSDVPIQQSEQPPASDPFGAPETSNEDPFATKEEVPVELSDDESAAYKEWCQKFDDVVKQKDEDHLKKREEMKDQAEEELEEHYSLRTNNNCVRAANNRENEEAFLQAIKEENEKSADNPWSKVLSMVDLTANPEESADKARMRGLLLQLKASKVKELESTA